jgi:hypothetical protein
VTPIDEQAASRFARARCGSAGARADCVGAASIERRMTEPTVQPLEQQLEEIRGQLDWARGYL